MKKHFIVAMAFFFAAIVSHAQQNFIGQVSVDYAKTISWWSLAKEMWPDWFEQSKDHMPKDVISYFNFTGDTTRSVYKRTKEPYIQPGLWYWSNGDDNVIFNDYKSGTTISQKPVYEETYLVQDSLLHIKWKITPDTRNIAGFNCRKAVGILFDTVAVFAFYTDEILINGGPEGIQGLPGMILGIGIPRLHTTWFATSVKVLDVNMNAVKPAAKGKKTDRASLLTTLQKAMKNWDEQGRKMLLAFTI
jgi:GLPGLI family protein